MKGISGNPNGRPVEVEPVSLSHLQETALALLEAEENYVVAIVAAREAGNSVRQIALVLGISHQKVSDILNNPARLSVFIGERKPRS